MMKRILIPLLFLITTTLQATTYYVSTSGNNANKGRTTATPWKTLQYAESHATLSGDIIALKKGDIWLLNTSVAIKHGGSVANSIIWNGSLWGSGNNAIIRSGGNRPDGNSSVVNIINCSYVTFRNIVVDGNNTQTFGLVIGGHGGFSNNVQNNENHIIIEGCSILNCGNGGDYRIGVLCQTWVNDISDITIQNCFLDGSDDEQLSFYPGKSQDGGTVREIRNIIIRNNTLTNWGRRGISTGYGLQINNKCTNVLVEGNTLTQGSSGKGNGFQIESNESARGYMPTGLIVRYNKIKVSRPNEWCMIIQQGQAKTATFYCNVFIQTASTNKTGGCIWIIADWNNPYISNGLKFYNNTLYTRSGINYMDDSSLTTGASVFKNNILYNGGSGNNTDICVITNVAGTTYFSNNLYYRSQVGSKLIKDGGKYKTSRNLLAWEPNSKIGDPLFKNISGCDFTLQPGSPAIGTGTTVPLNSTDIFNKPYSNPPSIGACESSH